MKISTPTGTPNWHPKWPFPSVFAGNSATEPFFVTGFPSIPCALPIIHVHHQPCLPNQTKPVYFENSAHIPVRNLVKKSWNFRKIKRIFEKSIMEPLRQTHCLPSQILTLNRTFRYIGNHIFGIVEEYPCESLGELPDATSSRKSADFENSRHIPLRNLNKNVRC